jgi:hypothetical protein
MKNHIFIYPTLCALLLLLNSCEQEVIDLKEPEVVTPEPCPDDATSGTANFSKFIAIGNSFVAGVQGGALFTEGQDNSLPAIINKQMECVGANATLRHWDGIYLFPNRSLPIRRSLHWEDSSFNTVPHLTVRPEKSLPDQHHRRMPHPMSRLCPTLLLTLHSFTRAAKLS